MDKERIDYVEQDIYDYFGADQNIWNADRHELLGIIGGMSGILELIWHGHVSSERSFKDFKDWLKETKELDMIQVVDNTDTPIKNGET
jgi:hypothetical protein